MGRAFDVLLKIVYVYVFITVRIIKLSLALLMRPFLVGPYTLSNEDTKSSVNEIDSRPATCTSVSEVAKWDQIEALDGQIAVLEQEKKLNEDKLLYGAGKPEQRIRIQKKIASIDYQIAQKSERVLKLREELN